MWYNVNMKSWLKNSCVVITGASSGIGKELCKILINKYDCEVIGVSRNEENLLKVKNEIEQDCKKGEKFFVFAKDVSKKQSWKDIFKFAQNKKANLVINNAGTMLPFCNASKITEEQLERVFKTNFYSIYYSFVVFNDYFKQMKKDCGFVNITSSSSNFLIPGQSIYSASKSAATKLSLVASSEVKNKYFIGTYLPGLTNTNIFYSLDNSEEILKGNKIKKICNKLGTSPQKVAEKIVKLTSKKKRYKLLGKDSKMLKLLHFALKERSSDFILKIFKNSKEETFKQMF